MSKNNKKKVSNTRSPLSPELEAELQRKILESPELLKIIRTGKQNFAMFLRIKKYLLKDDTISAMLRKELEK